MYRIAARESECCLKRFTDEIGRPYSSLAGLHFDEDKHFAVSRHDIQFVPPANTNPLTKNAVALAIQHPGGLLFAPLAGAQVRRRLPIPRPPVEFHLKPKVICLTGAKEFRWHDAGPCSRSASRCPFVP